MTIITIKTGARAAIVCQSRNNTSHGPVGPSGWHHAKDFVPADSERDIEIVADAVISIRETDISSPAEALQADLDWPGAKRPSEVEGDDGAGASG